MMWIFIKRGLFFPVWERSVKAWKAWVAAREASQEAKEARMAAAVEARMASAKKMEAGVYPNLEAVGPEASAPCGDGK